MNAALKACLCAFGLNASMFANAEDLGRLFFTPEQRGKLEYGKLQSANSGENIRSLAINGIVQKHGGPRTVWINGVSQPDSENDDRAPESLLISTPVQSQPIKVKVGQKVLINPASALVR